MSEVREAPCSGRRAPDGMCATCGHDTGDHDEGLICLLCHEKCDYCGEFRDQHTDNEWRSCLIDIAHRDEQADALAWWRSQQ